VPSIRSFLVSVTLSVICLVNFVAALHGYDRSIDRAERLIEAQLAETAGMLMQLIEQQDDIPPALLGDQRYFQLWRGEQLLRQSANAPGKGPVSLRGGYHWVNHQGQRWRLFVEPLGGDQWLVLGQRHDLYSVLIEEILVSSILPIIWVLPLLGVLIWWIVNHGLRPLHRLAEALHARRPDELQPLPVDAAPRELETVIRSINQLFGRLDEAFQREKHFAADAAHELRTPLAALKISLHNLKREMSVNPEIVGELEASVERMRHSTEQILTLHRLTAEKLSADALACDLAALAREVIAELYPLAQARGQRIALEGDDAAVEGDPFALGVLLRNLIDNACKYTPEGGEVLVRLESSVLACKLVVEDSGPGIDVAERGRVFDRFYRIGGDGHASATNGSGLGLSIVGLIVRLHRGSVSLERSDKLGGLMVSVTLPARLN